MSAMRVNNTKIITKIIINIHSFSRTQFKSQNFLEFSVISYYNDLIVQCSNKGV